MTKGHLIYRMIHLDNLDVCLARGGIHAVNRVPNDGLDYRCIHYDTLQAIRHDRSVQIAGVERGTLHDYVPFYFGPRSPMLYALKNGRVEGYSEGQEPLIYLVAYAERVAECGYPFVFSDGHGIMKFSRWFDDLRDLHYVDWETVNANFWADTVEDNDRKRRKQAEFLVRDFCPWSLIHGVAVFTVRAKRRVEQIFSLHSEALRRVVKVNKGWYY
jgi:hypothetical protein